MKIDVDGKEIKDLADGMQNAVGDSEIDISAELNKLGTMFVVYMRNQLDREKATGTLNNSISYEMVPGERAVIIRPTAPHTKYVAKGTKPHPTPLEPLVRWVKAKGLDMGRNPETIAKYVRYSIAKKGTSVMAMQRYGGSGENPFAQRTLDSDEAKQAIESTSKYIGQKIVTKLID